MTQSNETSAEQRIADCARIAKDCHNLALSERHNIMPAVRETLAEAFGAITQVLADRRRLEGEREAMAKVVERYPLTADNVRIYPGMKVYHNAIGSVDEWTVRSIRFNPLMSDSPVSVSLMDDSNGGCSALGWQIYSTRAAALAATPPADAGKGGER